jgi:hypothetical protein
MTPSVFVKGKKEESRGSEQKIAGVPEKSRVQLKLTNLGSNQNPTMGTTQPE